MGIETKVLEVETHGCAMKDTVRTVKEIGQLEKKHIEGINRVLIDTSIKTIRGKTTIITMYKNPENGKHFIDVNGKLVHAGDTRAACAQRAMKAGIYTKGDYNRVINKKVV